MHVQEDNETGQTRQDRKVRKEQDYRREPKTLYTVKTILGKGKDNLTLQQQGRDVFSSRDGTFSVAETGRFQLQRQDVCSSRDRTFAVAGTGLCSSRDRTFAVAGKGRPGSNKYDGMALAERQSRKD